MPEPIAPALSPEQIPTELAPHYVEPGTVYDDEPGEFVPPGWYVLGDHGHGEGADIEIKIEHAVDANGNDITGPLAAKIAELLAGFATEENDEAEAATPQSGAVVMTVPVTIDDDGTITPHDTGRMHLAEWWREHGANFTTAPRVPQPGDRVFGWAGRPFGTVHGFVVADEITNAAGFIAVKAPAVATPYAVDPTTVEVIETAPATEQPSVWQHGDSEPTNPPKVRDRHGDVWTYNDRNGLWYTPDTRPFDWDHITRKWGPVTEVRPADTGKETDR